MHAIMGPNGAGKSTLSHLLTGKPGYQTDSGEIFFKGKNLLELKPEERANEGLFLVMQYPIEIEGLPTMTFLKYALNAKRKYMGQTELDAAAFMRLIKEQAAKLNISQEMLNRPVNVGFSGGEKKRMETLQRNLPKRIKEIEAEAHSEIERFNQAQAIRPILLINIVLKF